MVGADHELRRRIGDVGDVALQSGQPTGPGLEVAVDSLGGAGELDEPVSLDRHLAGDGFLGLADLLVDAAQRAPCPISLVLVVDDLVTTLVGGPGRPRLGKICPSGMSWWCVLRQSATT